MRSFVFVLAWSACMGLVEREAKQLDSEDALSALLFTMNPGSAAGRSIQHGTRTQASPLMESLDDQVKQLVDKMSSGQMGQVGDQFGNIIDKWGGGSLDKDELTKELKNSLDAFQKEDKRMADLLEDKVTLAQVFREAVEKEESWEGQEKVMQEIMDSTGRSKSDIWAIVKTLAKKDFAAEGGEIGEGLFSAALTGESEFFEIVDENGEKIKIVNGEKVKIED